MTSWPDQPPQTRRQARESQRAAERELGSASPEQQPVPVSRRAATVTPTTAGEVPDVATPYSFASAQRDSSSQQNSGPTDAPPLRPRTPRYEDLSFDTLLAASHAGGPTGAASAENQAPATVAFATDPAGAPNQASAAPFSAQPAPLSYVPSPPASSTGAAGASDSQESATQTASSLPTVSPVDGHPLTRRELRAMLQAQAANQAVQPETAAQTGSQESESVTRAVPSAPAAEPADETTHRVIPPAVPLRPDEADPRTPISAVSTPAAGRGTSPVSPIVIPDAFGGQPPVQTAGAPASSGVATVATEPATQSSGPATDPQLRARGAGHWSTMDDENATGGTPRSAVSTGSVTTANALILPSIPSAGLSTSPLTSTGEVIVTGSIDLPKSLGATGQHPDHFDSSDIDRLFEESDAAPATSGVAPVRASKAVATHTSTRGMITPPKARGNKLPVVLAVTAAFLAIGVAALLVAGFVFHAF